jgi:hypothetical protein
MTDAEAAQQVVGALAVLTRERDLGHLGHHTERGH